MARGLPAVLAAVLAASACGRSAAPPRTVPEPSVLDEGQRRAWLKAAARAAAGDPEGAAKSLAPLLRVRPLHVSSHLLHQDMALAAGGREALAAEYLALSRELPGDASADVLVTRVVRPRGEGRLAGYQAAAVKDPAAPWPRIALATERTGLARDLVRAAAAKERDGFADQGTRLRGEARTSLERARTEGERAVAVAPDLAAAHAVLGHVLAETAALLPLEDREKRDLLARALERMGRALSLDPGDPRILAGRGFLLQDAGRGAEAQADFDAAAAAAPGDPAILAARARNLEGISMFVPAAEAWKEACAAAPKDPDLLVDYGSALARIGRWKDALAAYRRADAVYAAGGGERWKARRGLVTALAQIGLDAQDAARLGEALAFLRAYREEGGPDAAWAGKMAEVLGEESPPPAAPRDP